jgi:hypothetical protein
MATDKADLVPQRKDAVRPAAPRSLVSRACLFLLRSREASIAIAGIVLIIYFQSTASAFLSPSNIGNLAEYTAMTAIIAAGLVLVLISGEVDLSVGQVYALSPFVMYFAQQAGVPFVPRSGWAGGSYRRHCQWVFTVVFLILSFITTPHTVFDQWPHSDHPAASCGLKRTGIHRNFGGNRYHRSVGVGVTLVLQFVPPRHAGGCTRRYRR